MIDIPEGLEIYQPDFQHLLVDLNQIEAGNIQGQPSLKTILLALKTSREQVQQELKLLIRALAAVIQIEPALIRAVMLYLCSVDNNTDITDYIKQAKALRQPELQEEMMTIAEKLRREGKLEGKQEALYEDIIDILELRFQSVPYSLKKQLEDVTDTAILRQLLRIAVQAESIDAFTEGMVR